MNLLKTITFVILLAMMACDGLKNRFRRVELPVLHDCTRTILQARKIFEPDELRLSKVIIVESGFGCDQHGQSSTKAAVRACRNAIEFNSLPGLRDVIPGGKENMIIRVQIAVPQPNDVDIQAIAEIFPYGKLLTPEITHGGMSASSGVELPELGDKNDQMFFAIAVVSVGY